MPVEVTAENVDPTPTAVVVAATTWAEFPKLWGPMLDKVWGFLRGDAPEGLYTRGHNIMLYQDDVPNVEVGVQVTGSMTGEQGGVAQPVALRAREPCLDRVQIGAPRDVGAELTVSHLSRREDQSVQLGWLGRARPVLQEAHIAGAPDSRLDSGQVGRQRHEVHLMTHYSPMPVPRLFRLTALTRWSLGVSMPWHMGRLP